MRAGASPYVDWRDKRTYGNFTIHELSYSEDGLPQYGKSYDVPRNSVVEGSVVINDSTSEPGQFTVGSAISGTLSFEIYNFCGQYDSINWKGAWISAYIDVLGLDPNRPSTNESGEESICLKRYHVKSHTTTGNIIKITAVDILTLMDQHTLDEIGMTTTDAKLFIKLLVTRSMTLPGLITNVKLVYFDDLPNVSLKQPDNLNMTIRDALAYAAQCLGCYVRATYWEGIRTDNIINGASLKGDALEFGWYDKTPEIPADAAFSQTMDTDPVTITGVTITYTDDDGNDAQKVIGSDSGYMLRIPENPFVGSDNIDEVSQNIYNLVNGMSFYPGNFTIKSDPLIEAGDTILVTTPRHENIPVIVSDLSYKPGLVTANVSADIDTGDDLYTNQVDFVRKIIKDETAKGGGESSSGGGGSGIEPINLNLSTSNSNLSVSGDFVKIYSDKAAFVTGQVHILFDNMNASISQYTQLVTVDFSNIGSYDYFVAKREVVSGIATYKMNGGNMGRRTVNGLEICNNPNSSSSDVIIIRNVDGSLTATGMSTYTIHVDISAILYNK